MKELIEKIKQKGYWKVVIRPTVFKESNISDVGDCIKIIESCIVVLRGWDYPHRGNEGILISGNNSIDSYCDWEEGGYFEYWRFYKSGQFIHYFSMREDYNIDEEDIKKIQRHNNTNSTCFLSIISTLYSVTEIFTFAQRLAAKNVLGKSIEVVIELGNVRGRELFYWDDFLRVLLGSYICHFRDENIILKTIVSGEDLMHNYNGIALDVCMKIFKNFNWLTPPKNLFVEDQKKFIEKRL